VSIHEGLAAVRARIAAACARAGRSVDEVTLVAVTKTFPASYAEEAIAAGVTDIGENRVQEAREKKPLVFSGAQAPSPASPVRWHLIGHLQSNKAKKVGRFDMIHSIDSAELIAKVDAAAAEAGRRIDLLVQVDLAGEPTKHGAREDDLAAAFDAAGAARATQIVGLMLLPPAADPEAARPYFRALRDVRDRLLARGVDPSMLRELSMGMSHDFEVAVEEGSTIVRVGTAIFGGRSYVRH
jgi:pyridoxal phosphate enzyme (YggS family)